MFSRRHFGGFSQARASFEFCGPIQDASSSTIPASVRVNMVLHRAHTVALPILRGR
jgi:hypothetical protein